MRWAILGPFQVHDDAGREIPIPGARLRTLLTALLLRANHPVGLDDLCDLLWEGEPPPEAIRSLRVYVLRLRRTLGPAADRIVTKTSGYLCRVVEGELDVLEFEDACGRAATAVGVRSWQDAADAADRALALWRDRPLVDVPSDRLRASCLPYLDRLRLQILDQRCEAELGLGRQVPADGGSPC